MDHFLMAYCGLVNKRLVQALLTRGVTAVGLAAMDGGMVRGRRRTDIRGREGARTVVLHGDHAGTITDVDTSLVTMLVEHCRIPVICPPALGSDGVPINVDADRLAAELAVALGAERLLIFSDTNGFLADPDQPDSTVTRAGIDDLPTLGAAAQGRARGKLAAVERALRGGVSAVGLCDGRAPRPLVSALAGAGSWFTVGAAVLVP
jgi:acetylglutamate/LysW-gamma-L-alpha-aminoadipate kinase